MNFSADVVLIYPPHASVTQPYLSLPSLTAHLRRAGYRVNQHDTGPDVFDFLTCPTHLAACLRRIRRQLNAPSGDEIAPDILSALRVADACGDLVLESVEQAKAFFRQGDTFQDRAAYTKARNTLERAMDVLSAAHAPMTLRFNDLNFGRPLTWDNLHRLVDDESLNPYIDIIRTRVLPTVLCGAPLYGLSVTYHSQIVPALTFARLIKAQEPAARVVLGGAWLTAKRNGFIGSAAAFRDVDAYVFGEGETPLLELARRAVAGEPFDPGLPSVLTAKDEASAETFALDRLNAEDFDTLATPDYAGLDMARYLSPKPVVLLSNGRGCYWRRCTFCAVSCATGGTFRQRSVKNIRADIDRLVDDFGFNHIFFADDCIPPKRLRQIAEYCRGRPIRWQTEARFERALTPALLDLLYEGGCRQLTFGNESGNQRVLDAMDKGTDIARSEQIIRDVHRAGIAVQLQNFIGYPSETEAEAEETVNQLVRLRPYITSFAMGHFHLQADSPLGERPEEFALRNVRANKPDDIDTSYAYEADAGMARETAADLLLAFLARLTRAFPYNDFFFDGPHGAHISLYLEGRALREGDKPLLWHEEAGLGALLQSRLLLNEADIDELPASESAYSLLFDRHTASKCKVQRSDLGFLRALDGKRPLLDVILADAPRDANAEDLAVARTVVAYELVRKGIVSIGSVAGQGHCQQ